MRTTRALICAALFALVPASSASAFPQAAEGASAADVQRDLGALFAGMKSAVLAQDVEGYLAHVSHADTEYLAEQTYFAKDFAKPGKATKELSITLDPATLEVHNGSASATITWTWTQTQGEEGKEAKERTVSFPAQFEKMSGSWKYAGEKWHKHEQPGVLVLFDEGLDDAAAAATEAFTSVRAGVEAAFELNATDFPKRTKTIKLYASMRHLQQSICLSYEDGLSGWNEPGEPLKILPGRSAPTPARFRSLLAHEYGHCATFELGPKSNDMPWWILEGVADLMTEQVSEKARERAMAGVERWSKAGTLAAWDDLADFEKVPDKLMGRVYTQGHAMLAYITDTFTPVKRNAWMRAMSQGASLDQATTDVLGMPFADLDAKWRATLPPKEETPDDPPAAPHVDTPQEGT